jgi:hypothetical protein
MCEVNAEDDFLETQSHNLYRAQSRQRKFKLAYADRNTFSLAHGSAFGEPKLA